MIHEIREKIVASWIDIGLVLLSSLVGIYQGWPVAGIISFSLLVLCLVVPPAVELLPLGALAGGTLLAAMVLSGRTSRLEDVIYLVLVMLALFVLDQSFFSKKKTK